MTAAGTTTALRGVTNGAVTVSSFGTSGHVYSPAVDKLGPYAEQELAAAGIPGMTFSIVDAEGFAAVGTIGWADMDRRTPVAPSHLFQIGSISKSFAALCVYRLADEGKIDLDASLSLYLPDVPLPDEAISVQQILSHTAGLPRSSPVSPQVPDQRLWTGFKPGTNFSYSNTGYDLLGMLVQKITGKPYPLALRELVIEPLEITGLKEVIQASDRACYAVGYSPLDASGPNMTHVPLRQAPWIDLDTPAGSISATADAMTRYLQYLIAVGRDQGAPLFSNATAKRFSTVLEPAAAGAAVAALLGNGAAYASGLAVIDFDGHAAFHHIGGTFGFTSSMTVDFVTGVGCFVSANGAIAGYRPYNISKYACRLLRQVREGGMAPSPEATSLDYIESAEDYAGTYITPDGDCFQLLARSGRLFLAADGHEGRIQSVGEQNFLSDHPRFESHLFDFERSGNAVIAVWFGTVLYGRGTAVPQPTVPPELAALQGIYVSSDPLGGWRSVVAQGERLVIENVAFYRIKNTLHRKGDYWYLESTDNLCERIRFENMINGVPQRLNISGRYLNKI